MTRKQLARFIKMRNKNGFPSNLQFDIDAQECGITVKDLGPIKKVKDSWYEWQTPFGTLVERWGALFMKD